MLDTRLPTDEHLWQCMSETMRKVVLPSLEDPFARVTLIRLIGLAEYAPARGNDPTERRISEVVTCIDQLAARFPAIQQQLPTQWPQMDACVVYELCGQLLAGAVGDNSEQAQQIRAELKPLILAQLDEDLSVSSPLIASFGGQLNEK
ncbi:MAG: hypothetical protein HOC23_02630 [Halieaceae bacterium]|jgi:hypothetical protein|nr:hypothetical protein [Halieaceae bacterium]